MRNKNLAFILLVLLLTVSVVSSTSTQTSSDYTRKLDYLAIPSQDDNPIEITSNAELAQQSSAGVGTRSDPYIIEGLNINGHTCISIQDTTAFFVIRNSDFEDIDSGYGVSVVRLTNVAHGTIEDCYVRGGTIAINVRESTDVSVINCEIYDSYNGILIDSSDESIVVGCNSFSNSIGVMIINSDFCDIINNSIYSNIERGLHVEVFCENTTVAGNSIGWNRNQNAIDNGVNTTFTDSIVFGNEWSDYNSSDNYTIQGTGDSTDAYASLLRDTRRPTIEGVEDLVLDVESNGNTLTWVASERFHLFYRIYLNDQLTDLGLWDGREITVSLDDLVIGTHTYVLNLTDAAGNDGSDEVVISVVSFILGGIGTELVMLASGVTVVCFIIIFILIKRLS